MGVIARRIFRGRGPGGRARRRLVEAQIPTADGSGVAIGRPGNVEEAQVSARGVIRLERVHLLTRYGTACGLFDEETAAYDCALKSHVYRLDDYVGDFVEVTGALADVGSDLPVMNVTRLRVLELKWMR